MIAAEAGVAHIVGLVSAVVLGVVLCIAGALKAVDLSAWRSDSAALGVPWPVALATPVVELGLGALLVVGVGWPITPLLAAGLLTTFSAVVVRELRHGRRPRCACFGVWSSAPLSGRTLARNGVLLALAIMSLWR